MMEVKVSKDKHISRWVDRENLIYVIDEIASKTEHKDEGDRSTTLSKVKPVKNISKKSQSFQDYAYEYQNPFGYRKITSNT